MTKLSTLGRLISEHLTELREISKCINNPHDPNTVDEIVMDLFLSCLQLIIKSDLSSDEKGILLQSASDYMISFYRVEEYTSV